MDALIAEFPRFVGGFLGTLRLCLFAAIGALILGTVLAAFRVSPVPPLRFVGQAWVTVFRNSPLVVTLFIFAFGLPQVGIVFPTFGGNAFFWPGVAGLICYTAAFVCEAVRSGINSVPPGQAEAARAVGLTFQQTLGTVVLPQAFRTVVPPLGSVIIAMIKNSAIVGAFGVTGELFSVDAGNTALGYSALSSLTGVAIAYLVITIPAGIALGVIERKIEVKR
ncbi:MULTISPECIES: amino acid ABC transporter permease [unclassified Pseudonocardia]|uniref:amino acid ABC transporter permease n=1 Tax=unclassified Pseudonocardia TaxID=2619320 RepID=UPI000968DADC|nr:MULTISPECIES: amino acid ABC transporter permease [unclassified Pseudonocardia]MBN9099440.1 amino acid ABC transporter permease [Pseudonocardia sp.]OJY48622.1 MAG: amino acid ABC transporter permease [Pseudonocardia sp. 73-21]